MTESSSFIPCVGAIVFNRLGHLLLIQRGQEPGMGRWSLPGGRVEHGETDRQAVVREVAEETGLTVRAGRLAGRVHRPAPGGATYEISDYFCELVEANPLTPATDAADARWISQDTYVELPVVAGLTEALTGWSALPRG